MIDNPVIKDGKKICGSCEKDPCECVIEINGDDLNTNCTEEQTYG